MRHVPSTEQEHSMDQSYMDAERRARDRVVGATGSAACRNCVRFNVITPGKEIDGWSVLEAGEGANRDAFCPKFTGSSTVNGSGESQFQPKTDEGIKLAIEAAPLGCPVVDSDDPIKKAHEVVVSIMPKISRELTGADHYSGSPAD